MRIYWSRLQVCTHRTMASKKNDYSTAANFIANEFVMILFYSIFYTAVQLALGAAVIAVMIEGFKFEPQKGWGASPSDWDTISAGVTLLLATYLPLELSKYSAIMKGRERVRQKAEEVKRLRSKNAERQTAEIIAVAREVLESDRITKGVNEKLNLIYSRLDPDNEPQMDRMAEFEDSVVSLIGNKNYSVPKIYQMVLQLVLIIFFGILMPYAKCKPPHNWHALIDVALVGFVNNLILSSGMVIGNRTKNLNQNQSGFLAYQPPEPPCTPMQGIIFIR